MRYAHSYRPKIHWTPHRFWGKLIALIGRGPVQPAARHRTEVVRAQAGVIRVGDEPKPGNRRYSSWRIPESTVRRVMQNFNAKGQ